MIKYLGSKRTLLPHILNVIRKEKPSSVLDLFSGTSRVGHAIQNEGIHVIANDLSTYAYFLATTYVQADPLDYDDISSHIEDMSDITLVDGPGWFTQKYSLEARFFQANNSIRLEAMRNYLNNRYDRNSELYKILVVILMEAADRVDSTCGQQMAYLKEWSPRSFKSLELRVPSFSKGRGKALLGEALDNSSLDVEMVYLDPPYNQHNYLANYHVWETFCKWDNPETYGKVQKRADVKIRKSNWNSKRKCKQELHDLLSKITAPKVLMSFNDEGFLSSSDIIEELKQNSFKVERISIPYKRYVGAKIGIFNQLAQKVGKVKKTENKEFLFIGTR